MKGTLYLVPTPLDFGCEAQDELAPLDTLLPRSTIDIAQRCGYWITENAKSTRAFLKRVHAITPLQQSLQTLTITEIPREVHKKGDHTPSSSHAKPGHTRASTQWQRAFLEHALAGHDVALVSEAGMPAIADPGSSVVRTAHDMGIPVVPLSGSVSLMLALAASGLNGQQFAFHGYCPHDKEARRRHVLEAEQKACQSGQTQIWIETPYRNTALLDTLLQTLQGPTRLCLCAGLTLPSPLIRSASVTTWKQEKWPLQYSLAQLPCVFLVGR